MRAVQPDFLVCAGYKWLLGPYSVAFLYAAPSRRAGRPLEFGWITRAGSEDFAGLVGYRDDYQPGARRYDVGERSNFALLPMAIAALELLLAWGVERVAETIAPLTAAIEAGALERGLEPTPAHARAAHLIGIRVPGAPPDLAARLAEGGVFVSQRGDALRVSPHVYNTPGDVERLLRSLRA